LHYIPCYNPGKPGGENPPKLATGGKDDVFLEIKRYFKGRFGAGRWSSTSGSLKGIAGK